MSKLTIEIGAKIQGLVNGVNAAGKAVNGIGSRIKSALGSVGPSIAAAFTVGAIVAFGRKMLETMDEVHKGSQRIRSTGEDYQKLGHLARKSGTDIVVVENAMKRLNKTVDDASQGNVKAAETLARLGLGFEDLKGKSGKEQFDLVVAALGDFENASDRAAMATAILGEEAGAKLLPMIDAYDQLGEGAGVMSDEAVAAAAEFSNAVEDLKSVLASLVTGEGGGGLITWLTNVVGGLDAAVRAMEKMSGAAGVFKTISNGLDNLFRSDNPLNWINPAALAWNSGRKMLGSDTEDLTGAVTDTEVADSKKAASTAKAEREAAKAERAKKRQAAVEAAAIKEKEDAEAKAKAKTDAQDATVATKIKDMQDQVRWQKMINEGKEREVEVEKALEQARKAAKRELTDAEAAAISEGAGNLYDLSEREGKAGKGSSPLAQPDKNEISDSVRRIGGSIGGMAANNTKPVLDDMRNRLRSIDDKTVFPTNPGSNGARWPA